MSHPIVVVDGDFRCQSNGNFQPNFPPTEFADIVALKSDRFAVYKTHLDYLRAGAKIIRTNTLRLTPMTVYQQLGLQHGFRSLITTAVELARKAVFKYYEEMGGDTSNKEEMRQRRPRIAGCCGSYTHLTQFIAQPENLWNQANAGDIISWHRARIQCLINADVDFLTFEGIYCKMETEVLIDVLREVRIAPVWISFICKDDKHLIDGTDFLDIALHCCRSLPGRVIGIGATCPDPDCTEALLVDVAARKPREEDMPLIAYLSDEDLVQGSSTTVLERLRRWAELGVSFIGGNSESTTLATRKISYEVRQLYSAADPCSVSVNKCSFQHEENKSKL